MHGSSCQRNRPLHTVRRGRNVRTKSMRHYLSWNSASAQNKLEVKRGSRADPRHEKEGRSDAGRSFPYVEASIPLLPSPSSPLLLRLFSISHLCLTPEVCPEVCSQVCSSSLPSSLCPLSLPRPIPSTGVGPCYAELTLRLVTLASLVHFVFAGRLHCTSATQVRWPRL